MATKILIHNSADSNSILKAPLIVEAIGYDNLDLMDLAGVAKEDIDTDIGALADYDTVYITASTSDYDDGKVGPGQMDAILDMLAANDYVQAVESDLDASSGGNTSITVSGAGWTVNEFAGMYVQTTGGTGPSQANLIVSNTTDTITVYHAWTVNPAEHTIFDIVTGADELGDPATIPIYEWNENAAMQVTQLWETLFDNDDYPDVVYHTDAQGKACAEYLTTGGTGVNGATPGITDTGQFTGHDYSGYYAFTLGRPSVVAPIVSNTNDKLSVAAWPLPVDETGGSLAYGVTENLNFALRGYAFTLYIMAYLYDLSDAAVRDAWHRLLNIRGTAVTHPDGLAPIQDEELLAEMYATGMTFVDFYNGVSRT